MSASWRQGPIGRPPGNDRDARLDRVVGRRRVGCSWRRRPRIVRSGGPTVGRGYLNGHGSATGMAIRSIEVVIVGGGQAGLALSFRLTELGIEHVVLEQGQTVESWRSRRWDSLR